jgi:hypothetical protein
MTHAFLPHLIFYGPSVSGSNITEFLSLGGFFGRECLRKQPAQISRIEAKYSAVHFKHHSRNSWPVGIKHEKKSASMHS